MLIALTIVSIIAIICLILFVSTAVRYQISILDNIEQSEFTLKILQEIAYDYHVRIIRSGQGSLFIDNIIVDEYSPSRGFIDMGSDNIIIQPNKDEQISFTFDKSGKLFLINFRVLGKCYLVYGSNDVIAWLNLINKARSENKKLFSKSSYIDRNKI